MGAIGPKIRYSSAALGSRDGGSFRSRMRKLRNADAESCLAASLAAVAFLADLLPGREMFGPLCLTGAYRPGWDSQRGAIIRRTRKTEDGRE